MRIYHGTIISLDKANTLYRYLVEDKGRIIYLGDSLPAEYERKGHSLELGARTLLPAFGDGHMHFSNWALIAVSFFDVREAGSIGELQNTVRNYLAGHKRHKVVIGFGASKHSVQEKRLIKREELDAACPDIPLIIICYDGHSAVCNTPMLEKIPEKVKALRGFYPEEGHLFNEAYLAGTDYAASLVSPVELVRSINRGFDYLAEKGMLAIAAEYRTKTGGGVAPTMHKSKA